MKWILKSAAAELPPEPKEMSLSPETLREYVGHTSSPSAAFSK
jgi:hypothetical protein